MVKGAHAPLQIRLTEPVIYLRGPSTGADFRGRPQPVRDDGQHAMVRGLLTLRLNKATRIRSITVTLEGKSRTEWPEGIGSRRTDTYEENECINEKVTFFSAQEAIKDRAARRSQSVDPNGWAQQDLDSDDDDYSSGEEAGVRVGAERGRPLPSSVLPRHSGDWSSWQQPNGTSADAPIRSTTPSRQGSTADLSMMRTTSGIGLEGMRPLAQVESIQSHQSPSISSHPSSILLHCAQSNSRGRSPIVQQPTRRASDRGEEWQPSTPTGEPEGLINYPSGTSAGTPSGGVRFHSDAELEAQYEAALHETSELELLGLNRIASHRTVDTSRTVEESDADAHQASEYHPVNDVTMACPTNAVTTPTSETPPPASPHLGARQSSSSSVPTSSSVTSGHPSRPTSIHTPSHTSSLRLPFGSPSLGSSHPDTESRPGRSLAYGPASTITLTASGGSGSGIPDDRGRQKTQSAHKFSLTAALRGLTHDVQERVKFGSASRPSSRPGSRASSRTRGAETPRTLQFEESQNMSRNPSSQNLPIRAAVSDLLPHTGRSSRASSPARDGRSGSRGRSRSRARKAKEDLDETHNWKEFRKGVYNYPIAFQVPPNAPPSIHSEFGSVTYRLKASVVRVGALTPNLIEEKEIMMIAGPQEDDMEESENVIVERQWEDQMRYQIALSGKAFPIGGIIPISIRLMPLAKCKIYRITVSLEEKTDYFAIEKKVARHETPRRYILFAAKKIDSREQPEPLLPILSDASDAAHNSPLAPLARTAAENNPLEFSDFIDPVDNVYASLLDPIGPWHLEKELHIPDCSSRIKFTTKHESTNISVGHWLKVTIRVERGDDNAVDSKGRRKQFDIIIETPIKILDCRVNTAYNSLPSYDRLGSDQNPLHAGCSVHAKHGGSSILKHNPLINSALSHTVMSTLAHTSQIVHKQHEEHPPHGPGHKEHDDTLLERNIVYDRLISGQETETGEEPPTYKEAVAHSIRSASRAASRSHSRAHSRVASPSASRAPSRSQSRAPSRRASPTRGPTRNASGQLYIAE